MTTTKKLFDELCALEISDVTRFLKRHEDELMNMSIPDFVKRIDKIADKLHLKDKVSVETILAYTLKADEEKDFDIADYPEAEIKDSPLKEKRLSDAEHKKHKEETIGYAVKHLAEDLTQNPTDPHLNEKRASVKKQSHLVNKK